ncbi:hypothetical protein BV901_19550 [Serratia nematodiphila]|nr:hypothetical protein BV901_19550 [Serratia nematodiphila]
MSNRVWLYLWMEDGGQEQVIQLAEASNCVPSLWRILLAGGYVGKAITSQRVFGNAGTPGLLSEVRVAVERLRCLVKFLRTSNVSIPPAVFEMLMSLLHRLDDEVRRAGNNILLFSADLDELAWLDDDEDPERFITHECWIAQAVWDATARRMAVGDVSGVLWALHLVPDAEAADWHETFGLEGVTYNLSGELSEVPTVNSVTEAQSFNASFTISSVDGRVCLLRKDGECRQVSAASVWTHIWHAGAEDPHVYWVAADDMYGLARVDDDGVREIYPCELTDVWNFVGDVAFARAGARIGLLGQDGDWCIAPFLDHLDPFSDGVAYARQHGGAGLIGAQGAWLIAPMFERVEDLAEVGVMVRRNRRWGVKTRQDIWLIPAEWDELEWLPACDAFMVQRQGLQGLVDRTGVVLIEPHYMEVTAFAGQSAMVTLRANGLSRFVVKGNDESVWVVDGSGHILTPANQYADLQAFDWFPGGAEVPVTTIARYVCATLLDGERASLVIYDIVQRREVLRGDYLYAFALSWKEDIGWLMVRADKEGFLRVGIVDAVGAVLHAAEYWWIGALLPFGSQEATHLIPYEINACWHRGAPVAARRVDGILMWLHANGRSEPVSPAN